MDWVLRHKGMPLRVVAEYELWRRVEDKDGEGGWIHGALLSGNRTATVLDPDTPLHAKPSRDSRVIAQAAVGVIGKVEHCDISWCELDIDGLHGWVEKSHIWGVDPEEVIE